ncbi:MAG: hypothetical protein K6G23_00830 [Lachnospiraceae bacterium]|nr:hypothetical protein [Lachnospiraceae bacterium]
MAEERYKRYDIIKMMNEETKTQTTTYYPVPIAVIIFNRPEVTKKLAEVIKQVRPETLYIISDGAREDHPGEDALVRETREIMEAAAKPEHQVHIYAEHNMRCDPRISSGLDAVFAEAQEAIILEDDCIPDLSFFPFAQEMLERYRDNPEIALIGGSFRTNYVPKASYTFTARTSMWGWATWAKVWNTYRKDPVEWGAVRDTDRWRYALNRKEQQVFVMQWDRYDTEKDFPWDAKFLLYLFCNRMMGISPKVNLVRNIGAGDDATHYSQEDEITRWPVGTLEFPLVHPTLIQRDLVYEKANFREGEIRKWKSRFRRYILRRSE